MNLRILRTGAWVILVAAFTSQVLAQDNSNQIRPGVQLPFDLLSDFGVVVHGKINQVDGLRFLLDTGSSHSVIDRKVAESMGLNRYPAHVFNFDQALPIEWADGAELRVGELVATNMRVMVAPLADISQYGANADGILGLDVLSRAQKVVIDYSRRTVSFELGQDCGSRPSAVKALLVTLAIQGVPMHLVVDTGLHDIVLYADRVRRSLPHLHFEGKPTNAMIGRLPAREFYLRGIQLFCPEATTSIFLIESAGRAEPTGIDGYLGTASLHATRLELDFGARVLRWE
ncbi:hypothetical protein DYQ86_15395 [Acidobacteria bacterium AB60]|nr:hypothetical protein DYQ86_15395 [Acidobacteria bacterium AB60]